MPYVRINVGKKLSEDEKNTLQMSVSEHISLLPKKNRDNCMIDIFGDCSMYMRGVRAPIAFMEVRLYKASPMEAKKEFVEKMYEVFKQQFDIPSSDLYINILEFENFGVRGAYI
jgi:phenylpyruvate tautomerase PptA (4-oxalocrotonate tautomerase family)